MVYPGICRVSSIPTGATWVLSDATGDLWWTFWRGFTSTTFKAVPFSNISLKMGMTKIGFYVVPEMKTSPRHYTANKTTHPYAKYADPHNDGIPWGFHFSQDRKDREPRTRGAKSFERNSADQNGGWRIPIPSLRTKALDRTVPSSQACVQ